MVDSAEYVIISTVRDEEKYIEKTVLSVIAQTIVPKQWIIVNDNSKDDTLKVLQNITTNYPFIQIVDYPGFKKRIPGAGVVQAFNYGYSKLSACQYDYIVKLDGDLSFDPNYFQEIFTAFDKDRSLGIASGIVLDCKTGKPVTISFQEYTYGASKIYKKECFDKLYPLEAVKGWDMLDNVIAQKYGYSTRIIPSEIVMHLKPMDVAVGKKYENILKGYYDAFYQYMPIFVLIKMVKLILVKPCLLGGIFYLLGYLKNRLLKKEYYWDEEVLSIIREHQKKRIKNIMRGNPYSRD